MLIIHLFIVALFITLGIVFAAGKGAGLIAGYNTSSPEEKAKTDEKKLCKAMSKLMFTLAFCWLTAASSEVFHTKIMLWIGMGLFLVTIIVGVIYMNKADRFKK